MQHVIDAQGRPLGRIASEIAIILQGKHRPDYEPRLAGSDSVLVKNARGIVVTGRKAEQKIYYHHSGYVGHLKEVKYKDAFAKSPERVLREAVRRMLPKNFLNQKRMTRLTFEKDTA